MPVFDSSFDPESLFFGSALPTLLEDAVGTVIRVVEDRAAKTITVTFANPGRLLDSIITTQKVENTFERGNLRVRVDTRKEGETVVYTITGTDLFCQTDRPMPGQFLKPGFTPY
ncbi:MAG: hypothetical protein V1716_04025 [Candidatus Uhrbacteria bacterium]